MKTSKRLASIFPILTGFLQSLMAQNERIGIKTPIEPQFPTRMNIIRTLVLKLQG